MDSKKEEKKRQDLDSTTNCESEDLVLDGKTLHDLYRHTAKLIK